MRARARTKEHKIKYTALSQWADSDARKKAKVSERPSKRQRRAGRSPSRNRGEADVCAIGNCDRGSEVTSDKRPYVIPDNEIEYKCGSLIWLVCIRVDYQRGQRISHYLTEFKVTVLRLSNLVASHSLWAQYDKVRGGTRDLARSHTQASREIKEKNSTYNNLKRRIRRPGII